MITTKTTPFIATYEYVYKLKNHCEESKLHEVDLVEGVGIGEDGLALFLLLVSEGVAAYQFVYYLVGLG
jgi:hypothetical protein